MGKGEVGCGVGIKCVPQGRTGNEWETSEPEGGAANPEPWLLGRG